jgi:hypothetical protein
VDADTQSLRGCRLVRQVYLMPNFLLNSPIPAALVPFAGDHLSKAHPGNERFNVHAVYRANMPTIPRWKLVHHFVARAFRRALS